MKTFLLNELGQIEEDISQSGVIFPDIEIKIQHFRNSGKNKMSQFSSHLKFLKSPYEFIELTSVNITPDTLSLKHVCKGTIYPFSSVCV